MKHVRPNVVTEILDPVRLLEEEKPLAEPTRGVVQRVVDPAFTR